ncbi:MAG: (2Fe-2S)-binding protein [Oligoflexia bacterium]|nr:(2Fe-2S)-binding protein [Oligoflexia bacterium]
MSDPDRLICFCHTVSFRQLQQAIRAGARTFEDLQERTRCSTGCGGCAWEVREILAETLESEALLPDPASDKGKDSQ